MFNTCRWNLNQLLNQLKISVVLLVASLFVVGCGPNGGFRVATHGPSSFNSPSGGDGGDDTYEPGLPGDPAELGICSDLALEGVSWPNALTIDHKRSLALALNISGSFEGPDGWANLTDNFDNQGISFGLLNQNLGQGSLQPLLIQMRDQNAATFRSLFSSAHYSSILGMLKAWEKSSGKSLRASLLRSLSENESSLLPDGRLSLLDRTESSYLTAMSAESDSVKWAVDTLYSDNGRTFYSSWENEFKSLGANPKYVSLQIGASQKLHSKALGYMQTLKMKERRAYLFFFDVAVQNGGLYDADIADYNTYFKSRPQATETERLNKILELRLRKVNPVYVADVRSRKSAIINGSGTVHGSKRNFEAEYCYSGRVPLGQSN